MKDWEKRAALHKILDLVLDINGLEERKQEVTGDKPTAFFTFSGHMASVNVDVYENGWSREKQEEPRNIYGNLEYPGSLHRIIDRLEKYAGKHEGGRKNAAHDKIESRWKNL